MRELDPIRSKNSKIRADFVALTLVLFFVSTANALVVSEEVFVSNGGELESVLETIERANAGLRAKSLSAPFQAVGWIGNCTATWLGNEGAWSYILTAAHCSNYDGGVETEQPTRRTFRSYRNEIVASGNGTVFLHPYRVDRPEGHGGASTDIALLKLPLVNPIVDDDGEPVSQPILYDGDSELSQTVEFVGYGLWGVGETTLGGFSPQEGLRRLWGESVITSVFEREHGIGAIYVPKINEGGEVNLNWAQVASGDSGSAWWQDHQGVKTIVATTNGGHATFSTGARVSQYAAWVKSIYAGVRVLSEALEDRRVLLSVRRAIQSDECSQLGTEVELGLDSNLSETLDENEIEQRLFLCEGELLVLEDNSNPTNATLLAVDEDLDGECEFGGWRFQAGTDSDQDSLLASAEVDSVDFVCLDPEWIVAEERGGQIDGCNGGGLISRSGYDLNQNSVLDDDEVSQVETVCDESDAETPQGGCAATSLDHSFLYFVALIFRGTKRRKISILLWELAWFSSWLY